MGQVFRSVTTRLQDDLREHLVLNRLESWRRHGGLGL